MVSRHCMYLSELWASVFSLIPRQCPGNEATMLPECHRSHDYITVYHKIVFSLPVWMQVLTLTISRTMSCGWILSTPMAKGSVQWQSVVKCLVSFPDPLTGSCWESGNETLKGISDVGVTRSIVLCCPDTSLGTQPSFQTQLAWSITWLLREERYGVSSSWNIVHQWPSHLTVTDCVVFQMVTIIDPHIKRDSGYHIHQVGVLLSLPV